MREQQIKLYCLSGLGVDHRAFQKLNPEGVELVHVAWIEPLRGESLEDYSRRFFAAQDFPEVYNLLGVSFGGMIATEFAKIRPPKNLILVSSINNKNDLPLKFRLGGALGIHKVLPKSLLQTANIFNRYLFSIQSREEKKLLHEILKETDTRFLRWALSAILRWNNKNKPKSYRIHGTKDRILKGRDLNFPIENAGHFMIVNRAHEISALIENLLFRED